MPKGSKFEEWALSFSPVCVDAVLLPFATAKHMYRQHGRQARRIAHVNLKLGFLSALTAHSHVALLRT